MNIAIFGGTFDPIHCAHTTVAREAADAFQFDRVLFVPAANPPHKHGVVTEFEYRYRMVELACAADPRFVPSRLEDGEATSYSVHTIEKVRAGLGPSDELFFIIGADAFAEIGTWYRWRDVVEAVQFVVVTRPGHEYQAPRGARVRRLDTLALPVSSSDIRADLAAGKDPAQLDPAVLAFIKLHHLYC